MEFVSRFGGGEGIDHMKLQKLLYFAQGWWLALTGEQLLTERPQVWRYGPVFRGAYNAFNRFGRSPIPQAIGDNPIIQAPIDLLPLQERQRITSMVDWVWGEYGHRTGIELSDDTHAPGTPWQRIAAANRYSVPLGTEIPAQMDYEYFAQLAAARGWAPAPFRG